jgi:carboxymethylenebutenolidase
LSKRHKAWGELWDGAGLRRAAGRRLRPARLSGRVSAPQLRQPPEELNEVTVRPLDAYGALAWLRTRADVDGALIALLAGRTAAAQRSPPWRPASRPHR